LNESHGVHIPIAIIHYTRFNVHVGRMPCIVDHQSTIELNYQLKIYI